jgi:elongation factor G
MSTIHALLPLAESFGYTTSLRSATQGRANFSMEFNHYEPVPPALIATLTEQEKAGTK